MARGEEWTVTLTPQQELIVMHKHDETVQK